MKKLIIYIILILTIISCDWIGNASTDSDLYSLYRQRIDDSKYVFYEFGYSGSFVTSSDYIGITILDSTESFQRNKIDKLPSSLFAGKPSDKNLKLIRISYSQNPTKSGDTLMTPIAKYQQEFNNVKFEIIEYQKTYGSATKHTGLMRYEFDSLEESNDSLFLYNITKKFGGKHFPINTSFGKGNIKLVEADDTISYIQIYRPVIERGSIYKPTAPFELVPDQPVVGVATYEFYPRQKLNSDLVSDNGIWKKIK